MKWFSLLILLSLFGCGQSDDFSETFTSIVNLENQFLDKGRDQGRRGTCYFYAYVAGLEAAINRYSFPTKIAIDDESAQFAYLNFVLGSRREKCSLCDFVQRAEKYHFMFNLYLYMTKGPQEGRHFDLLESGSMMSQLPMMLFKIPLYPLGSLTPDEKIETFEDIRAALATGGWNNAWEVTHPNKILDLWKEPALASRFMKVKIITRNLLQKLEKRIRPVDKKMPFMKIIQLTPIKGFQEKEIYWFIRNQLEQGLPLVTSVDINGMEISDTVAGPFIRDIANYGTDDAGKRLKILHLMALIGIGKYGQKHYYLFRNSWAQSHGAIARLPIADADRFDELSLILNPNDPSPKIPRNLFEVYENSSLDKK
jgi:hypothetical protein